MNGLDNISNKIIADAEKMAGLILSDASRQAEAIVRQAKEQAEAELAAGDTAAQARCADMAERARLAAGLERRRLLSSARQEMIGKAFDTALERLISLPEEQYRDLLCSLAAKALADGEGGELLFNERDRSLHGEAVVKAVSQRLPAAAKATLSDDLADIPGGLVIRRGKIELNCALDVTVRMLSESMAFEINGLLFPEGA